MYGAPGLYQRYRRRVWRRHLVQGGIVAAIVVAYFLFMCRALVALAGS